MKGREKALGLALRVVGFRGLRADRGDWRALPAERAMLGG
jgi:hypothetical protein